MKFQFFDTQQNLKFNSSLFLLLQNFECKDDGEGARAAACSCGSSKGSSSASSSSSSSASATGAKECSAAKATAKTSLDREV